MTLFPLTEAWLAQLPEGWGSFPEAQAKASMLRQYLDVKPLQNVDALPPHLHALVTAPPPMNAWVPYVHHMGVTMAYREECADDAAFYTLVHDMTAALYRSPAYKLLMVVATKERLLRAVEKRWATFHRGTTMQLLSSSADGAVLLLTTPPFLYAEAVVPGLRAALSSVFAAAKTATEMETRRTSPTTLELHVQFC